MAPPKQHRLCSVLDCGKPHLALGYCAMHRQRFVLYGDPLVVKVTQLHGVSIQERWEAYLPARGAGCWEWQGYRDPNGYGRLNVGGKPMLAHRLSWEFHFGPITPDEHICHRCDNPPCVRPEHLFKGDYQSNTDDKMAKKRHRYGVRRGTAHERCKVTEDQVREIRADAGKPGHIAERYGLSRRTVRDIQTRKSWKHIP